MASNNPQQNIQIAGAITFPTNRNENVVTVPVQPRQPQNMQGLLRFAMEATKAEDAPGGSTLGPIDEERKKFLEEALKSLTVDVAKVLQDSIKILSDSAQIKAIQCDQELPDQVQTAFNNLLEFIDDIDVANDFYKLGGFAVFPVCLGCESAAVRAAACDVLAELCQNNPYCQSRVLECGLLNILLNMADNERHERVLLKTMYAISCATREFEASCKELVAQNGCEILIKVLHSDHLHVRTKAAFLVRYLCSHYPDAKTQFVEKNLARHMAELIAQGRNEASEHILSSLIALVEDLDSTVLEQCRDPDLGLKQALERYLEHPCLQGDTDFVEEKEYCEELLKKLFENWSSIENCVEENVDR